ncbi:MAG: PLP-dependent aspartate aminotransferase family protein [Bacteroidia bacterium]
MHNPSEILTHYGEDRQGSVAPVLNQSSNFCFRTVAEMREALANESSQAFYSRGVNPTVATLRTKLAALEGSEECLVFSSGSAAIAAAVIANVKAGDHIVCVQKPYSWTTKLLDNLLGRFGVEVDYVDGKAIENWEAAIKSNTRIFMLESPNSGTFEQQDIEGVAALAKRHSITTIIDNSYATPLNQKPLEMGIDISIHSASKYLNGHGDIVAGVLCCSKAMYEDIFKGEFMTLGGIISPHDAWLMLRGLRTLHLRMDRVAQSTPKIVAFLKNHPKVARVYYPFDEDDAQFELAKKQMKQAAGQFSIELNMESPEEVEAFCNKLQYFLKACSWGGYESLIFPALARMNSQNYHSSDIPFSFIRFYVGFEDVELLIQDLENALS